MVVVSYPTERESGVDVDGGRISQARLAEHQHLGQVRSGNTFRSIKVTGSHQVGRKIGSGG